MTLATLTWWTRRARRPLLAAVDGVGCLTILGRATDGELVELAVVGNLPGLNAIAWRARAADTLWPLGFKSGGSWRRVGAEWMRPVTWSAVRAVAA